MSQAQSFLGLYRISIVTTPHDCGIFFVLTIIPRWMLKIVLKDSILPIIYPFPHQTARSMPEVLNMGVGGKWNFLLSPPLPSYSAPGNEGNIFIHCLVHYIFNFI